MSDQQTGGPAASEDTAALGFMAFLGLMFGGAGILIAALAVGAERAWSGRQGGPGSSGWRQSVADHRDWLASDRQRRVADQRARQQWWRDGADPAARPVQPSWPVRAGTGVRRWWARLFVSADRVHGAGQRFGDGFRAGWAAALQARRDGASPWETATTRPVVEPDPQEAPPGEAQPTPDAAVPPPVVPQPQPQAVPGDASEPATAQQPQAEQPQAEQNTNISSPATGGTTMTAPTTTSAPAGGETHLDLTDADLTTIHGHLSRAEELNDQMAGVRAALEGAVAAVNERAAVNGATSATQRAADEANAVVALLGQHLSNVSDAIAQAKDHTSAAQAGLAPARDAQDTLQSAGARGEFVSTATSD